MFTEQIVNLKPKVQTIIDFIAKKDWVNANVYLHEVSEEVEDLIDSVSLDAHLIELGKYQVLLKHLLHKNEFYFYLRFLYSLIANQQRIEISNYEALF